MRKYSCLKKHCVCRSANEQDVAHGPSLLISATISGIQDEHQLISDPDHCLTGDDRLGVIQFLREENDVAEAKLALTEAETKRWQQQSTLLERNLRNVQAQLDEARQQTSNPSELASQHEAMVKAIEQNRLLMESNQTLRLAKSRQCPVLSIARRALVSSLLRHICHLPLLQCSIEIPISSGVHVFL